MLKKLVKYGNSNAIILDKAILELLDISEGAILKIKTDGKSLIITPHQTTVNAQVSPTFTHEQALAEASVNEWLKKYPNIEKDKKELILKEFNESKKFSENLYKNEFYIAEFTLLRKKYEDNLTSSKYIQEAKQLRYKYSPEIEKFENNLRNFEAAYQLENSTAKTNPELNEEQMKEMHEDFAKVFSKNKHIQEQAGKIFDNPDYQHEMQLLAEKYKDNKDSKEYLEATQQLMCKFIPGYDQLLEDIKAVSMKYKA